MTRAFEQPTHYNNPRFFITFQASVFAVFPEWFFANGQKRAAEIYYMNTYASSFIQADNLVTRQIAGETIIVPIRGGVGELNAIFTLNPMGTKIWDMLGASTTYRTIVHSICQEYEVTPDEVEKDLTEFLGSLSAAGLICSSPQDGG